MTPLHNTITVLLPVHDGADSGHFNQAMSSLFNQCLEGFQILLLVDGPVGKDLTDAFTRWIDLFDSGRFEVLYFERNRGLGPVLNDGLMAASGKYIARMDADDICEPDRLALQVGFLESHPDVDVVGSNMIEFQDEPTNILSEKRMPQHHDDILRYAALRNPVNHPTVMFRRQLVIDCGGYRDMPFFEDYDLWVRLIGAGARFHNLPVALIRYRVSVGFFERRRGLGYLGHQYRFVKAARNSGFISFFGLIQWLALRNLPFVLPRSVLKAFYRQMRK